MRQRESKNLITEVWRHFKVWIAIVIHSVSRANTYRTEVVVRVLRGFLIVGLQILLVHAVVGSSSEFVGWSIEELYLLAGVFNLTAYISWSLFSVNLWRIEEKILKGEFDFLLLKPLSSVFTGSFIEFFLDDFVSSISGFVLIGYYVLNHLSEITLINSILFLLALFCSGLIYFSIELATSAFDFVVLKNGFRVLARQTTNLARYPMDIWSAPIQVLLFTLLPVALISHVPAKFLLGHFRWEYILVFLMISSISVFFSSKVWKWGIKRYTSAGG